MLRRVDEPDDQQPELYDQDAEPDDYDWPETEAEHRARLIAVWTIIGLAAVLIAYAVATVVQWWPT
jgi:hypothetical protein